MQDPYLYPGTDLLKNKLNIKDSDQLSSAEADFCSLRLRELAETPLDGSYDHLHLSRMHHFIFQDLYEWAGHFRTIDIEKAEFSLGGLSVEYTHHPSIEESLRLCLDRMTSRDWKSFHQAELVTSFCFDMASLWKIHPFREGNTRTVITFCCQFADEKIFTIKRSLFEKNSIYMRTALVAYNAVFHDLGDLSQKHYLERIVQDAFSSKQQPR